MIPENDKRFHYEDEILTPEPIDNPDPIINKKEV